MSFIVRVTLVLLLMISTPVRADAVRDLYFAQTIVTGTEEPERTRGLRDALTEVVIKLTGDPRLAGAKRLAPLLEDPAPLVERFAYEDRMKDLPVRDEQGTRERPHFLRVWFKPEATDKAIADLGLRQWGKDRPPVSVHLAISTGSGAFWLAREGERGALQRAVLIEAAQRRGLPIELSNAKDAPWMGPPLIEDAQAADSLASKVAQSGAALIGTLTVRDDGTWRARWWLAGKKSQPKPLPGADAEGVSFDVALKRAIDAAVLAFAG